jgi:hypothetical protein
MLSLGNDHPNYLPSSVLSKKIKTFHDNAVKLLPFLQANTSFHEIDTEQIYSNTFKQVCKIIEPIVIHIRAGGSINDFRKSMVEKLQQIGFVVLEVNNLISEEGQRRTAIGQEFSNLLAAGKSFPSDIIVRLLRKIIYSGDDRKRFILSSFPDIIEQAKEFERSCAEISAIIYPTSTDQVIEIKNNNLNLFSIDSLF